MCRIIQKQLTLTRHSPVRSYSSEDSDGRVVIDQKTCGVKYLRNSLVSRSLPCGLAVPACLPPRAGTLHPRAARIADQCRAEKESPGGEILKEKQPRRKADDHRCDKSKKHSTGSTPQTPPAPEEWKRSHKMGKPWPSQPNYNSLMRRTHLDKFQSPDQAGFG